MNIRETCFKGITNPYIEFNKDNLVKVDTIKHIDKMKFVFVAIGMMKYHRCRPQNSP